MPPRVRRCCGRNLTQSAASERIHRYYPGAPQGGTRSLVQIPPEWVTSTTALTGPNVHAFADLNDNDVADAGEETAPSTPPDIWSYGLTTFPDNIGGGPTGACTADFPCTWDPDNVTTSAVNKNQNVSQVFYFVNNFHDHLAGGADRLHRRGRQLRGRRDPVWPTRSTAPTPRAACRTATTSTTRTCRHPARRHAADDADVPVPLPGHAATRTTTRSSPSNGGDEADVVYHEYTHGLSNRSSSTRRQLDARHAAGRRRWARPGATGTRWTTSSTRRASQRATPTADGERPRSATTSSARRRT